MADFDLAIILNLRTLVVATDTAIPLIRKRGGGSLLYTASTSGIPYLETMAIPVGGPWVTMANEADVYPEYLFLALNGIAQIAGIALAILGLVLHKEVTRPVQADLGNGRSISLSPWVVPGERGGAGLQLVAEF